MKEQLPLEITAKGDRIQIKTLSLMPSQQCVCISHQIFVSPSILKARAVYMARSASFNIIAVSHDTSASSHSGRVAPAALRSTPYCYQSSDSSTY